MGVIGRIATVRGAALPLESPQARFAAEIAELVQSRLDPSDVAARVLTAIREDDLYAFTHPQLRVEVEERCAGILAAMDKGPLTDTTCNFQGDVQEELAFTSTL